MNLNFTKNLIFCVYKMFLIYKFKVLEMSSLSGRFIDEVS